MSSFLSILKTVGADLEKGIFIAANAGQAATPIVTALDPPIGVMLGLLCNSILQVEQLVPGAGLGPKKKQLVIDIVGANGIVDPTAFGAAIDGLVATFNALAAQAKR
jgi:hypothetical protein